MGTEPPPRPKPGAPSSWPAVPPAKAPEGKPAAPPEVETKSEALAAAAGAAAAAFGAPGAAAAAAAAAAAPTPSPRTERPAGEAPAEGTPAAKAGDPATPKPDLREEIVDVLHTCYDPEIPVDIYELGLVYGIDVSPEGDVKVQMTLTSPACPVAESLPPEVQKKVASVPGVRSAKVDLVWEPPWGKHLMSEAALLQLGFM